MKTLLIFTVIRISLLILTLLIPDKVIDGTLGLGLQSILFNPVYTLTHLRDGHFLSFLRDEAIQDLGEYSNIYQLDTAVFFRTPPLVLSLVHPLLSWAESLVIQNVIFSILMIIIDLFIALTLKKLAANILFFKSAVVDWEQQLEPKMNSRIHPSRAWVLGSVFGENYDATIEDTSVKLQVDSTTTEHPVKKNEITILHISDIPDVCAILYYCNPISIIASSGVAGMTSLQGLWYLLFILAFTEITRPCKSLEKSVSNGPNVPKSMFYLALVSYVEINHIVYLVPMILLAIQQSNSSDTKKIIIGCILFFALWSVVLQYLSMILVGSSSYQLLLTNTYTNTYSFIDLSPNIGVHWYLFVQIFQRFRDFFAIVCAGLPYITLTPLILRLYRYPFTIATSLAFIWSVSKPCPVVHDLPFLIALLPMSPRSLIRTSNAFVISLFSVPVPIILYVTFYWMWLEPGNGNPNYMFFQCLAYSIFVSIMGLDFISSTMKRDKALRLTEKLRM